MLRPYKYEQVPVILLHLINLATTRLVVTSTTPRLDAELLLTHLLGWSRARLLAERDAPIPPQVAEAFMALVERRASGEPVAYLVGHKEFYGYELLVDRRVLVPRPETELLVEVALAMLGDHTAAWRIADLGSGSGAIAIALGLQLPHAQIEAVDLSPAALEVAAANVERHALSGRVRLVLGDLCAPLAGQYDLIVSNPPYTILAEVEPNVLAHEPHLALEGGGADGADLYRRIFAAAPRYLRAGGSVLCEIGAWQGEIVSALAQAAFPMAEVRLFHDLAGHPRVVRVATAT
nr:peptide chain release factor N(5)-glutamine methyltransferase [Candidatus Oscillochloris fontis]